MLKKQEKYPAEKQRKKNSRHLTRPLITPALMGTRVAPLRPPDQNSIAFPRATVPGRRVAPPWRKC